MKLSLTVLVTALAVAPGSRHAISEAMPMASQPQFLSPTCAPAPPLVQPPSPAGTVTPVSPVLTEPDLKVAHASPTTLRSPRFYTLRPPVRSAPRLPLRPGVYQASPFACIVVVPTAHPDDRCIIGAPVIDPKMPMGEPKLRLVPRHAR